ncbi:MAG: HRDC domain-containing protein [Chloroflexota bacterium]|nr:HRDC domain-containing protein [Chloroflexota bacterium]
MLDTLKNIELVWVDQPQELRDVIDELSAQDILAIDTESNSLYAYQEQVCLIQFSTREKDILIDALVLPDLSLIGPIFNSNKIMKVFHAAEYDLICLFRDYGFQFNFLFDTMIAARTLGYQKVGLGSLLRKYFSIQMDKKYQRANWGKRPLKPEMLEYARLDSRYLIPLAEHLERELRDHERWELALEDFTRLTQNIEVTTGTSEEDFWKLRGARDLTPQQAAILKSVYRFRKSIAEKQNRPPFRVFSQQAMVEIAKNTPKSQSCLAKLPSLNIRQVNRYGKGLIQAVTKGKNAPPEYPPHHKRLQDTVMDRIDSLREWRKMTGCDLGVPSDVILPRDVLNRIAYKAPMNLDELAAQMQDVPYRFNHFGGAIIKNLQKGKQRR